MAKTILKMERAELATKLISLLREDESDGVKQQVAIELLKVSHAVRMGNRAEAVTIANGVHKHVLQLIGQTVGDFYSS